MVNEFDEMRSCVEEYLKNKNIHNCVIKIRSFEDNAAHFMSKIATIEVQGKDENEEELNISLFGKIAKGDEEFRIKIPINKFFQHEIYVYEHIFPLFSKLQNEKKVVNVFKSYPNFCGSSKKEFRETVILENVAKKGFKTFSGSTTLDYEHALLLMKEVGRLHALSFALADQKPDAFSKIKNDVKDVEFHGNKSNEIIFNDFFPQCMQLLDPVHNKTVIDQYKHFQKVFFQRLQESVQASSAGPYAVVTHCDLWISNLLFKYNCLGKPSEVCFLDWQLTKVSSPASDLSEITWQCLDKDTRDKHYSNLIKSYYKSFSSFLKELGSDPNVMFPYQTLQEHLKNFSVHGLYIALRTITLTSMTEKLDLTDKKVFEKFRTCERDASLFSKRIKDILIDYITYGYNYQ